MTKERRLEIYQTLLRNMQYDENCGNVNCPIRQQMQRLSVPEKLNFEAKRIDGASCDEKVVGNSFDAALYLVKKFNGVMIQKHHNNEITHYYVAYLDENGIVRAANPASDFLFHRQKPEEFRLDILLENFRKNSLLDFEINSDKKIINGARQVDDFCKITNNVIVHNFIVNNGFEPSTKELKNWGIDPNSITRYLAESPEKKSCEKNRTK